MNYFFFIEAKKVRATRLLIIIVLGAVAVSALSTYSLWQNSGAAGRQYGPVLISEAFFSALIWPIVVSALASRQAEIEYQNRGWILNVMAGVNVPDILYVKSIIGSALISVAVLLQAVLVTVIGKINGIQGDLDGWLAYHLLLWATLTIFYGSFLLIACAFKNQILVLVTGVVSSFIAVFCFLTDFALNYILPWSYFAMILPYRQEGASAVASDLEYVPIFGFLFMSAAAWFALVRRIRIWR